MKWLRYLPLPLLLSACQSEPAATAATSANVGEPPAKLGLCSGCHGTSGRASLAGYPHLAGQDPLYLRQQLQAYRSGQRQHAQMQSIAGLLDDADIESLSDWYASRPTTAPASAG